MASSLEDKLNLILEEKTTKIIPTNIKKDVQIFDVVGTYDMGTDTSDADATENDIAYPKTAYVKNQKITGTMNLMTSVVKHDSTVYEQDDELLIHAYYGDLVSILPDVGVLDDNIHQIILKIDNDYYLITSKLVMNYQYYSATNTALWNTRSVKQYKLTESKEWELVSSIPKITYTTDYSIGCEGELGDYIQSSNQDIPYTKNLSEIWYHKRLVIDEPDPTKNIINDNTELQLYAYSNNIANVIGLVPEKLAEGNTILGVKGASAPQTSEDYTSCLMISNDILTGKEINTLNYIQSSGTQYIDTGIIPTNNTVVEMSMKKVGNIIDFERFFGAENAMVLMREGNTNYELRVDNVGNNNFDISSEKFDKVRFGKGQVIINDIVVDTYTRQFTTNKTAYIFYSNRGDRYSRMQLQYCKIWEGEELTRSFIPVKDFNDVFCLYDEVNKKFYYNQGTGNFIGE